MDTDIKYTEKVVAFLDILGFKNMVGKSTSDAAVFKNLADGLKALFKEKKDNEKWEQEQPTRHVSTFSDSLVISYDLDTVTGGSVYYILLDLTFVCIELLQYHLFVRGGVTVGQMYHDKNICFGPAMVKAYQMEEKAAIYPRVIVDMEAMKAAIKYRAKHHTGLEETDNLFNLVTDDGLYFYLLMLDKEAFNDKADFLQFMEGLKNSLEKQLTAPQLRWDVKDKYRWFALNCYNEAVKRWCANKEQEMKIDEHLIGGF